MTRRSNAGSGGVAFSDSSRNRGLGKTIGTGASKTVAIDCGIGVSKAMKLDTELSVFQKGLKNITPIITY